MLKYEIEMNEKQKRTKNHIRLVQDKIFYGRYYPASRIAQKTTATAKKAVNLIYLYASFDGISCEDFCAQTNISPSNYRRLHAIVKKYMGIDDGAGNSVEDTPANRRYFTLLCLYEKLRDCGVDMRAFCGENGISRATFFRYLNIIENYLCNLSKEYYLIALDEDGRYFIVDPSD